MFFVLYLRAKSFGRSVTTLTLEIDLYAGPEHRGVEVGRLARDLGVHVFPGQAWDGQVGVCGGDPGLCVGSVPDGGVQGAVVAVPGHTGTGLA